MNDLWQVWAVRFWRRSHLVGRVSTRQFVVGLKSDLQHGIHIVGGASQRDGLQCVERTLRGITYGKSGDVEILAAKPLIHLNPSPYPPP